MTTVNLTQQELLRRLADVFQDKPEEQVYLLGSYTLREEEP